MCVFPDFEQPLVLPPSLKENLLDFGVRSATDTSSITFVVVNSNPIEVRTDCTLLCCTGTRRCFSVERLFIHLFRANVTWPKMILKLDRLGKNLHTSHFPQFSHNSSVALSVLCKVVWCMCLNNDKQWVHQTKKQNILLQTLITSISLPPSSSWRLSTGWSQGTVCPWSSWRLRRGTQQWLWAVCESCRTPPPPITKQ